MEMVKLEGTEKQVIWAESIRKEMIEVLEKMIQTRERMGRDTEEHKALINRINQVTESKFFIEKANLPNLRRKDFYAELKKPL